MPCCLQGCSMQSKNAFGVPKNEEQKLKWEKSLRVTLKKSNRVCSNHFKDSDIIRTWTSGRGLYRLSVELKRWKLKKNAIPYLNIVQSKSESLDTVSNSIGKLENVTTKPLVISMPLVKHTNKTNKPCVPTVNACTSTLLQELKTENIDDEFYLAEESLVQLIMKHLSIINIPKNWFFSSEYVESNIVISFHKLSPFTRYFKRYIEKQLIITNGSNNVSRVILLLNFKKIPLLNIGLNIEVIDSIESLQVLLIELNEIKCCRGVVPSVDYIDTKEILESHYVEYNDQRWHKNCETVIKESIDDVCWWCKCL